MFISEWSILSQKPPTKGHAAPPHDHEQPLGTHTHLPDEAHLRVHDIVYQVLEKISNFLIFVRVKCISEAIHAVIEWERDHLLQSGEMCEKLRKVTAHCKVLFKG